MAEPCTTCNLRTKRVFSTVVNSDQSSTSVATPTTVSADGKYVLYNFTNTGASSVQGATGPVVGGIIYSVNCGTLNPIVTISPDMGFDSSLVVTNAKFRQFYVLEEVTSTNPTTQLQIKSFTFANGTLTPTGQSVFLGRNIVNLIGGFVPSTNFASGNLKAVLTPDSRYLILVYNTTPNVNSDLGDITISILNAQTLAEVGTTTVLNGTSTTIAGFSGLDNAFALINEKSRRPKDYFAISTGFFNLTGSIISGPFTVKIFKISPCGQPTLVKSVDVPQFVNTVVAYQPFCHYLPETLIMTAGQVAVLPTDNSILEDTSAVMSALPNDNRNLRIYSFDGRHLKLIIAEAFETGLVSSAFAQDAATFALVTTNQSYVPSVAQANPAFLTTEIGITQFYRICRRETHCTIEPLGKFTLAGATPTSPLFNPKGDLLFEGFASFENYVGSVAPGAAFVKNVSVLRILGDCIQNPFPPCKTKRECSTEISSSSTVDCPSSSDCRSCSSSSSSTCQPSSKPPTRQQNGKPPTRQQSGKPRQHLGKPRRHGGKPRHH